MAKTRSVNKAKGRVAAVRELVGPRPRAARSVSAKIQNQTGKTLTFKDSHLYHGIIAKLPPETISPGGKGSWRAESAGAATGTEGYLRYEIGGNDKEFCLFYWDNPFIGSNEYLASAPKPHKATANGTGGEDSTVRYTVK